MPLRTLDKHRASHWWMKRRWMSSGRPSGTIFPASKTLRECRYTPRQEVLPKGGVTLPVYRCARGFTSLESFHNHLNHLIPGTSANLENFQAYLLEGLERWNEDRVAAAVCRGPDGALRFDRAMGLARYLVQLREKPCLSDREASVIIQLWDRLSDSDKQGVSYPPRHTCKATHSKTSTCHGKESLNRRVLGQAAGLYKWPNTNRIVEAVCLELCWSAILYDYQAIKLGKIKLSRREFGSQTGTARATSSQRLHVPSVWATTQKRVWACQDWSDILLCHHRGEDCGGLA